MTAFVEYQKKVNKDIQTQEESEMSTEWFSKPISNVINWPLDELPLVFIRLTLNTDRYLNMRE